MLTIAGFKEMKPFTKIMSIVSVYGFVPVILADGATMRIFFAFQMSSILMLLFLSKTGQYWKD